MLIDLSLPCPTGNSSSEDERLCAGKRSLQWSRDAGGQHLLTCNGQIIAVVTDAYEEVQLRVCIPHHPDWTFSFCKDDVDDPIAEAKRRCEMKLGEKMGLSQ